MSVTGDGKSKLIDLIHKYPRAWFRAKEIKLKHRGNLNKVVRKDEVYYLSYALNLSRGRKRVSLVHEIDSDQIAVFDKLSHYTKQFYYGRYNIRCASIEGLKQGKNFTILEFNGCGAEPHHAYENGNTLFEAYAIFLHHRQVLYKISHKNRLFGVKPWGFRKGILLFGSRQTILQALESIGNGHQDKLRFIGYVI